MSDQNEETRPEVTQNPSLYHQLSEPFASLDACNEAFLAFQRELYDLRKKHRIRDLTVICEAAIVQDGDVGDVRVCSHFGSSLRKLPALAFAYGEARAEQEAALVEQEQAGKRYARRRAAT